MLLELFDEGGFDINYQDGYVSVLPCEGHAILTQGGSLGNTGASSL